MRDPLTSLWLWRHQEWTDHCPCGGRLVLPTSHRPLRQCVQCGMIGRTMRLTRRATGEFYVSGRYRRWLTGSSAPAPDAIEKGKRRGTEIITYLKAHGLEVAGRSVLEMGCGVGGVLLAMREAGAEWVCGFELDPVCVHVARSHGLAVNEATENREATIGILSHVLEHTYDPVGCLRETLSWLPSGSLLYLEYPIYGPTVRVGPHHNWYFARTTIHVLCNQLGLVPVDTKTAGQALLRWGHP